MKTPMRILYRSPGLPTGVFNRLGTLHMHIDGAQDQELILRLVQELERRGNPGKLDHVDCFIAGPQRKTLPEVYQSHTPELGVEEALQFFSTSSLKSREDTLEIVNFVSDALGNTPGIIIEVEQPVMWLGPAGWKLLPESGYVPAIEAGEVRGAPSPSLEFEIHHGFDLPKTIWGPPVPLSRLGRYCEESGISFGGWFVFEKSSTWAYRSNSFSGRDSLCALAEREQQALNLFLKQEGLNCQFRTLVEKVLGIWHKQPSFQ